MKINRITYLPNTKISLPASKSISNRILILNALSGNKTIIHNLSKADDAILMSNILDELKEEKKDYIFNIKNAGTTLRFLTAFLCQKKGAFELQCDERMKKRPIGELVDALKTLGAKIKYLDNDGFPPLKISGTNLISKKISISGKISSQYISALLMIAPTLPEGLVIEISDQMTSRPYIEMTLKLMSEFGINYDFRNNFISIKPQNFSPPQIFAIESDWSAASYWYGFASLLNEKKIILPNLFRNSIQGDSRLIEIYKRLGVETIFANNNAILKKNGKQLPKYIELNLQNEPDLAPSIAVNLCLLNINFKLSGLENLRIKECDRTEAIIENLQLFGYAVKTRRGVSQLSENLVKTSRDLSQLRETPVKTNRGVSQQSENLVKTSQDLSQLRETPVKTRRGVSQQSGNLIKTNRGVSQQDDKNIIINDHNDHRIAMAFSLMAVKQDIEITNPKCVEKSYPNFWENF